MAGVPISLRPEGDTSANNQVSGTVIDLATQVKHPLLRPAHSMAWPAGPQRVSVPG